MLLARLSPLLTAEVSPVSTVAAAVLSTSELRFLSLPAWPIPSAVP